MGPDPKIAIISGGGSMPLVVARSLLAQRRDIHLIGLQGEADPAIEAFPHSWTKWGKVGELFNILEREACREVVFIGTISRPDLSQISFDLGALRTLPLLLSLRTGGDDTILSTIVNFFEEKGYQIKGAHQLLPDLLCPQGVLGRVTPKKRHMVDIETGFRVVEALGALDVGQAAIVSRGYVLGVEAAEGTDELVRRCRDLRQWGSAGKWIGPQRSGVLVKAPKPGQEQRIDMPTIGPKTLELAAETGLAGIALRAAGVLLADRERLIKDANDKGLFILGLLDSQGADGGRTGFREKE